MGGFAGGDEGGYWDEESIVVVPSNKKKCLPKEEIYIKDAMYSIRAYAKVNIFFKITGLKKERYTIQARYMRVQDVYDTISFVPCTCGNFTIEGCEDIPLESNSIYKAYKALNEYLIDTELQDFFYEHKVVVTKRIPLHVGLGGSSSDGAAFMRLAKEVCNLMLSTEELVHIGTKINHNFAFFIYNYVSANISGYGEIVAYFEEELLHFELENFHVHHDKNTLYKVFDTYLLSKISLPSFNKWKNIDSKNILNKNTDSSLLNDLYKALLVSSSDLKEELTKGWYVSNGVVFKPRIEVENA
ncbi:4-(cytidine 5'-diphospho)-2-C-methyl-D-erythritol kinase [Sulfurimonas sp. SAG-AH-194-I05]|nr:4-(cytidine 5'-diphospho)-2-C-methyl-D-erythritol kinase [Sulfurimonas sp. SAG-AH-194-I05]MDF1875233.1 4-(cytidine 5'-diphospho)-2-C-methyl-D-erythritol kinase [Sulfurimonas sp. SAG-AH-194-I05]